MWKGILVLLLSVPTLLWAQNAKWEVYKRQDPQTQQTKEFLYASLSDGYYLAAFKGFSYLVGHRQEETFEPGAHYEVQISFDGEAKTYPFVANDRGDALLPAFRDPELYNVFLNRTFNPEAYRRAFQRHMSEMKEHFASGGALELSIRLLDKGPELYAYSGTLDPQLFTSYFTSSN